VDHTDHTAVTNNFLHTLFSQCNIRMNDVNVTRASEHYHCCVLWLKYILELRNALVQIGL
jgi:hypothetical protein